ncbi:hypothetical protein [Caenibacillus caldisaponilyticus]|uniref:hypothetical protein n=1 Tax=Caenibacillus caldisaponilyticus TaxID=1674942 RepID=UPI0009884894|nr:hypothetical protein [Caenibacillus caldisaponilyticus]
MIKDYAGIKASACFIDCHRLVQRPHGTAANQTPQKATPDKSGLGVFTLDGVLLFTAIHHA